MVGNVYAGRERERSGAGSVDVMDLDGDAYPEADEHLFSPEMDYQSEGDLPPESAAEGDEGDVEVESAEDEEEDGPSGAAPSRPTAKTTQTTSEVARFPSSRTRTRSRSLTGTLTTMRTGAAGERWMWRRLPPSGAHGTPPGRPVLVTNHLQLSSTSQTTYSSHSSTSPPLRRTGPS